MTKSPTPAARLARMQESFDKDHSILAEDYEFFRTEPIPTDQPRRGGGFRGTK